MSLDALPYTVWLLLLEAATGHVFVTLLADLRGTTTRGFVRLGAGVASVAALLGLWLVLTLPFPGEVAGYPIRDGLTPAVRGLSVALAILCPAYAVAGWGGRGRGGLAFGVLAALTAAGLLAATAALLSPPIWGYAGIILSLAAGSFSLGLVNMAMSLGHWYLVTPRLPERPLRELTGVLMLALVVQAAIVAGNALAPGADPPPSAGDLTLGENPAFWLRVGVGLVFPTVLAFMAWRSSAERAMMSATGLLYIAVGAVLAGETLARSLLFATAAPL